MGDFHLLMPPHCLATFLLSLSPTSTALGIVSPSVIQCLKTERKQPQNLKPRWCNHRTLN